MRSSSVDNWQDIIDSRDVIARIEELESEIEDAESEDSPDDELLADLREELAPLQALASEGEGYYDWQHGAILIRDSYFVEYARQLADDCGMTRDSDKWPYTCIDWERAASELQQDYSCIDFDGVDYWVRG